jgi:hypothetical protein
LTDLEKILPGSWIKVGKDGQIDAVVCTIRPRKIEVVYLNEINKAVHKEVQWAARCWNFTDKKSEGKPADKDQRLAKYVKILRSKCRT